MKLIKDFLYKEVSLNKILVETLFNTKNLMKPLIIMMVLLVTTSSFMGLNAIFISRAIDINVTDPSDLLSLVIGAFGIAYLFMTFKLFELITFPLRMWIAQKIDGIIEFSKVEEAVDILLHLPSKYWHGVSENELVVRLDVRQQVKFLFWTIFRALLPSSIEIIVALIALMYIGIFAEVLVVALTSVGYILFMMYYFPKITKKHLVNSKTNGKFSSFLMNMFELGDLVKTYGSEKHFIKQFQKEIRYENNVWEDKLYAITKAEIFPSLLFALSLVIIFVVSYSKLIDNEITVGVFTSSMAISTTILFSIKNLVWVFQSFMEGTADISFPFNILLNYRDEVSEIKKRSNVKYEVSDFSINNLVVKADNKVLLDDVSFKIAPNEKVWLIGHSGSGKSTLISTLLGFRDYTGEINYAGEKLKDQNIFAYVPQSVDTITGTIKFNLLLGNQLATDEEMWDSLAKVGLSNIIKERGGLNSRIENSNFSGGQLQKLSIARALLSKRPFIVMDEPTAALDMTSERQIVDIIKEINASCLISIHRLHAIPKGDRIIELKDGKLVRDFINQ